MPQLVLSGSLKGPTGEPAANAEITFTSRRTTDIVLQQTVFTARADAEGEYQIALEYGVFDITVKLDTAIVALANRVQISEQTTATTLNQLIVDYQGEQALTPQIIVEFRELTAEARGYRDEAQASAQAAATSESNAADSAGAAEAARDAAMLTAGVYADTAAGLAATADGDHFTARDTAAPLDFLILYRNDAGVATEIDTYPTAAAMDEAVQIAYAQRAIVSTVEQRIRWNYDLNA